MTSSWVNELRWPCLNFNDADSEIHSVKCRVLQGASLHPLSFLVYVDQFEIFATELFTILFAVDSYFCTSENAQDDIHIVGKKITSDWMIKGE